MSFPIYLLGFLIVIGGVAWGLSVMGVPTLYITIACVIMVGLAILTGVSKTRQKDPSTP
jgi:membrane-bound acyltransferase YfiQ involved in biofilm formation